MREVDVSEDLSTRAARLLADLRCVCARCQEIRGVLVQVAAAPIVRVKVDSR